MLFRSVAMRPPGRGGSGPLEAFGREERDADPVHFLAEVASARLVHVVGERTERLERRFDRARRSVLARYADALVHELPNRRPRPGSGDPSLASILSGPGGLTDTMLAALLLRTRFAEGDLPILKADGIAAVFEAAGEQQVIDGGVAGDLADAARLWLNLDGIRPLVVDGDLEESGLEESCRAMIARACDAGSIEELRAVATETAARTAAHIDALVGAA